VSVFRNPVPGEKVHTPMATSAFACGACHGSERDQMRRVGPNKGTLLAVFQRMPTASTFAALTFVLAASCAIGCQTREGVTDLDAGPTQGGDAGRGGQAGAGIGGSMCQAGAGGGSTAPGPDGGVIQLEGCAVGSTPGSPNNGVAGRGSTGIIADGGGIACPTQDTPPDDPAALRIYQAVVSDQHSQLQRIVGRYACGGTPLYRGTFMARDDAAPTSSLSGVVLASLDSALEETGCASEGLQLGRQLTLTQPTPTFLPLSLFQPNADEMTYALWTGVESSCAGCVADFRTGVPAEIDLAQATFSSSDCATPTPTQTAAVTASGQLTLVAAPSIDDIIQIDQLDISGQVPTFTANGTEMVAEVDGWYGEPTDVACYEACSVITRFHVEWFVDRREAKRFGLRNFRIDPPQTFCCSSFYLPA
jgi:hypothetical protein